MYLKRIELEGFKSFADRTVIPVQDGLTGIVGPNGCGKSNVVDALLWVMGERSAKALRADAMDDVIFKGAEGRAGGAYSMVEIILGDDQGDVVEPGGEVAVGRRLFRTGESEFLLHGRKVRRKDVRNLLMDTGLGVRGYMVLAQGKIDAVLAANPAERRSVFEEAAGISRYKARKQETLRKLASANQDLARVDDVLGEVQRSVRSLRYQAGKAKRYLEIRDRYRELRIGVALADQVRYRDQERRLRDESKSLEQQLEALRSERGHQEELLRSQEQECFTLRQRHDSLRGEAGEIKERIAGLEERVHGLEARALELDQRHKQDRERLQQLLETGQEQQQQTEVLQQESVDLQREYSQIQEAEQAAAREFEQAREVYQRTRERVEELRQLILEALAERTQAQNALAAAAQERSAGEGALSAVERRSQELDGLQNKLSEEEHAAADTLAAAHDEVRQREGRVSELIAQRDELRRDVALLTDQAAQAREQGAEAKARLEALASFEEERQGVPEHVRQVLAASPEGVYGLLLEGITIAPPWDRLLENFLGRMQQALWLESRAVGTLLQQGSELQDACFDLFFKNGEVPEPASIPGAQRVLDLLQGDPQRCQALGARLGSLYCVENAEQAAHLATEYPQALFLAKDGELHASTYARKGMLSGEDSAGILARHNARKAAQAAAESALEQEQGARVQQQLANDRLEGIHTELDSLEGDLRAAVGNREAAQARHQELCVRRANLSEEKEALQRERVQLQSMCEKAGAEEDRAAAGRDAAEEQRLSASAELEKEEQDFETREQGFERTRAHLQEARIQGEKLMQRLQHAEERLQESSKLGAKSLSAQDQLRAELHELDRRSQELRDQAEENRQESRQLLNKRAEVEQRVEEAAELQQRAQSGLEHLRQQLDGAGNRLEQILGRRQEQALELQRVEMQREELARSIVEEFHQSLDELAESLDLNAAVSSEQAGNLEDASENAGERDNVEGRYAAEAQELQELKRKLESLGHVNLEAVQELENSEERANFLESERTDLLQAQANLEKTLEELDAHCRERFLETFGRVKAQFEGIFRRLFRGGRAELDLEADADPLDGGIEISVRPPGKELRSINLLSGGERTLTALALLLAVFRSRPSPFCLLDEVDAALDDANVERFLDVLNDFTDSTQFLVVTHNRITMAACSRLFGVTMRRAGVSQIVSVDLEQLDQEGGDGGALPPADRLLQMQSHN